MSSSRLAKVIVSLTLVAGLSTSCSTSVEEGPQPLTREATDDDFLDITDCRELEILAADEVDRIGEADDQTTVDAARERFDRIVAHRDSIC